ncbi:myelin and lymphocyte protein [Bacillus rossius redtenbacheri]|uniref:myelin and lymphocyte protein n=1 Tax=Bacillus rossius redtenbacheri TaxID=93214 RepID=UPI002FDECDD7
MMTEVSVNVGPQNAGASPPSAHHHPTVKTDPGQGQATIKVNVGYFKTVPGIIKLVQLLFGIICMACASPAILGGTHWFLFVAVTSFIATLVWVFVYLLGIREALKIPINWILTELLNTCIITVMYLIAFIVQLSVWAPYSPFRYSFYGQNIAAGAFGIFNCLAYAAGAYFLFVEWKTTRTM